MPSCLCESWLSRCGHLAGEGRRERFEDEPWQAAVLGKVGEGVQGSGAGTLGEVLEAARHSGEGPAPEEVDARAGQFPI